jgi:hypothetical protein
MYASVRRNSNTPALAPEPVKTAGGETGVRNSVNGRFVPRTEVKNRSPRETETERLKLTKKTK